MPTPPCTEHTFRSFDGTDLFYRAWLPPEPKRAVLLFHRGHEHSGRWEETVRLLDLPEDFAVFAWDQRGHGRSPGERGYADSLSVITQDADAFARHVAKSHGVPTSETVIVSHSVGAVVAAAWVHDFAPPVRGMVLATPAFKVRLYVPAAIPALRLKQKALGDGVVKSYVKSNLLTHDTLQAIAYDADPLIFRQIAVRMLLDLNDTAKRLIADAAAITTPTLLISAGKDWVVNASAAWKFYEKLGTSVKQKEVFPQMRHAVFHEIGREQLVSRVKQFVLECFDLPSRDEQILRADRGSASRTEFDRLRGPGAPHWKATKFFLGTAGRLSRGVALGWQTGFDSGVTLDYVYANQKQGNTPLGRLIDHNYLESIGWRGIRVRRQHLEALLKKVIASLHSGGRPVHIVDVAAGPGRYVLETLKSMPSIPATALLRDYQTVNVEAARRLIAELNLPNAKAEPGDAFDRAGLAALSPKPTIAIVSGLLELFPDNAPARTCFAGLADAIEPGGYLLYTNQPWHPQVEFIARVLTNREGNPWIMRRRSQEEMDTLVKAAGFEKVEQKIDQWGIFTVSLARRV